MDIEKRTMTQLRDRMDELITEAALGDVFLLTKVNKKTGAVLAPEALIGEAIALAATGGEEDELVARLLEVAPGRLATDQERAARRRSRL